MSLIIVCLSLPLRAEELTVAVASNFAVPMREIAAAFEQTSGQRVRLAFGSSGKFYAQIRSGAPFQVFLSADQSKPKALEEAGLAVPGSRFTYAVGALALWSRNADLIQGGPQILQQGSFRKLALANPRLAPYGAAAVEVLERLDAVEATRARWVRGENIAQAYQFVASGNAELGFVALSQIIADGKVTVGSSWLVPAGMHQPIRQDAVLLTRGAASEGARALLDFMRSERARAVIAAYGYRSDDENGSGS